MTENLWISLLDSRYISELTYLQKTLKILSINTIEKIQNFYWESMETTTNTSSKQSKLLRKIIISDYFDYMHTLSIEESSIQKLDSFLDLSTGVLYKNNTTELIEDYSLSMSDGRLLLNNGLKLSKEYFVERESISLPISSATDVITFCLEHNIKVSRFYENSLDSICPNYIKFLESNKDLSKLINIIDTNEKEHSDIDKNLKEREAIQSYIAYLGDFLDE